MQSNSDFFQMLEHCDERMRSDISASGSLVPVRAGHLVYAQASPADCVYVIISGVVEATVCSPDGTQTRALDVMTRGKVFGELGVLANQNRSTRVSVREDAELIRFEKQTFLRLLATHPAFSCFITVHLAKRLHESTLYSLNATYGAELHGQLRSFDLLTVFQAITAASHSGELRLSDSHQDVIGRFFFEKGHVKFARFAHLEGIEAVWQGFLEAATEGAFAFEPMLEARVPFNPEHAISIGNTDLLMQGAAKKDALQLLPLELRAMEGRLAFSTPALVWKNEELKEIGAKLWDLGSKRPQPLKTLWRRMNFSTVTFLQGVQECLQSRQAELRPEQTFKQTTLLSESRG